MTATRSPSNLDRLDGQGSRRRSLRDTDGDRPLAEILGTLGRDVSELVQAQLDLAKLELREDARNAAKAGAMAAGAAAVGVAALLLLGMSAAWAIAEAWPTWSGFLIVAVAYALVAAVLVFVARNRIEPVTDGPTQTIQELQEDARWLRQHRS